VLNGSLGQEPGNVNPATYAGEGGSLEGAQGATGSFFTQRYGVADRHIVQIGVNIIDQWKTGNYPTAIFFLSDGNFADPNEKDLYNTVFGIKDLPYLTQIDTVVSQIDSSQTRGWGNEFCDEESRGLKLIKPQPLPAARQIGLDPKAGVKIGKMHPIQRDDPLWRDGFPCGKPHWAHEKRLCFIGHLCALPGASFCGSIEVLHARHDPAPNR
jgi:hypothetical protein